MEVGAIIDLIELEGGRVGCKLTENVLEGPQHACIQRAATRLRVLDPGDYSIIVLNDGKLYVE